MKAIILAGGLALGWPLAVAAQRLAPTHEPVSYLIGPVPAPLFRSLRDTVGRPAQLLAARTEVRVVGNYRARWAIISRDGFLYVTPTGRLTDYDPEDGEPLPLDARTQRITYSETGEVPGASQAVLFARATAWLARSYAQQNAHVEVRDSAAGKLVVQGQRVVNLRTELNGVVRPTYAGVVQHTLTVYVRPGRYKYVFTNLTHDAQQAPNLRSGGPLEQRNASLFGYAGIGSRQPWDNLKTEAARDIRHLADSLQSALTLQPPVRTVRKPDEF